MAPQQRHHSASPQGSHLKKRETDNYWAVRSQKKKLSLCSSYNGVFLQSNGPSRGDSQEIARRQYYLPEHIFATAYAQPQPWLLPQKSNARPRRRTPSVALVSQGRRKAAGNACGPLLPVVLVSLVMDTSTMYGSTQKAKPNSRRDNWTLAQTRPWMNETTWRENKRLIHV